MSPAVKRLLFGSARSATLRSYISRTATAGGTLTSAEIRGAAAFDSIVRAGGIRSKIHAFYLLAGGLDGATVPFYASTSDDVLTVGNALNRGPFVPGDWSSTLGLTNNGSAKWFASGINNTWATWPNHSLFAGVSGADLGTFNYLIGASSGVNVDFTAIGYRSEADRVQHSIQQPGLNSLLGAGVKSAYARWHISRGSATLMTMYKSGVSVFTDTGTRVAPLPLPYPDGLAIGGNTVAANSAIQHLRGSLLYAGVGLHMTAAEVQVLDDAILAFLTAVGRPTA